MSENEKTPTDAGTPVETEIAADEQTPDAGGQATTKGAPATVRYFISYANVSRSLKRPRGKSAIHRKKRTDGERISPIILTKAVL